MDPWMEAAQLDAQWLEGLKRRIRRAWSSTRASGSALTRPAHVMMSNGFGLKVTRAQARTSVAMFSPKPRPEEHRPEKFGTVPLFLRIARTLALCAPFESLFIGLTLTGAVGTPAIPVGCNKRVKVTRDAV
jgi:hypothetical protein